MYIPGNVWRGVAELPRVSHHAEPLLAVPRELVAVCVHTQKNQILIISNPKRPALRPDQDPNPTL
jgi:hypothetical protein